MEFVEGRPLLQYCDEKRLQVPERLRLFREVCAGVHHAHRNLVMHRDLKPSNVLISPEGTPKLLDFGIGKVMASGESHRPDLTRTGQRILTPMYASPEQIRGESLSTASDIYTLGVVLYELLTGHQPYAAHEADLARLERLVCEEDPQPPSAAITRLEERRRPDGTLLALTPDEVSSRRSTGTQRLRRRIQGDLDNVVLRAMSKEPDRRYASAEALSEDIRRHLEGRTVRARPDTWTYRTRKFLRRNRTVVAAVAGIVMTMLAASGLLFLQSLRIQQQAGQISFERDRAERVIDFLTGLFETADPDRTKGATVTARELLDRGAAQIRSDLAATPDAQAQMFAVVGPIYETIGEYDDAERLARDALAIQRSLYSPPHPALARGATNLATSLHWKGRYDESEAEYRSAIRQQRALYASGHPELARNLGFLARLVFDARGELDESEALYRESIEMLRDLSDGATPDLAWNLEGLGVLARRRGDNAGARDYYEQALEIRVETQGGDHPEVGSTLNNLAIVFGSDGDLDGAETMFQRALDVWRSALGPAHPEVASGLNNLARLHWLQGDLERALTMYRDALDIRTEAFGGLHPVVAQSHSNLGLLLNEMGEHGEAERHHRVALNARQELLGVDHPSVTESIQSIAEVLRAEERLPEAERLLLDRHALVEVDGPSAELSSLAEALADLYERWGRPDEAARYRSP